MKYKCLECNRVFSKKEDLEYMVVQGKKVYYCPGDTTPGASGCGGEEFSLFETILTEHDLKRLEYSGRMFHF